MIANTANANTVSSNTGIDLVRLHDEAKVGTSYEHLAALFNTTLEELLPYKKLIEDARLVGVHEFTKIVRERAIQKGDDYCIRLWAQLTKLIEMDRTAPPTDDEKMTPEKVMEIFSKPVKAEGTNV